MATAFLSDIFGLFTKKTCIYLPHNHETFTENCVVWETKYFFRKEVYSSRGRLRLESTSDDDKTDPLKEEVRQNDFKQRPAIEKLRPVIKPKKDEYSNGSARNKAMMKNKMGSGRYTGQQSNFNISDKSKLLAGPATRTNFSKMNADRNNVGRNDSNVNKYSDRNRSSVGQFSNVDNKITRDRNASHFNAQDVDNSSKNYLKSSNTKLDKGGSNLSGRRPGVDSVNSYENRQTTNKMRMAGEQLSQRETMNAGNRRGNMNAVGDAARIEGSSYAHKNNFNQISGGDHSEANSNITRTNDPQNVDMQNKIARTTFGDSTNPKSIIPLSSNAYDNDQTATARNKYGICLPSESGGVRSSFPSSCNKTNLVYDERQKTLNFGAQCTEKSFFQDDNTTSVSDNKTTSKSSQTEQGMFILKITTGRQN